MDMLERAREVIDIEMDGLRSVRQQLNGDFVEAVRLILTCISKGGKIVVTGVGKSLHIGQKIAATLTSTGTPAVVLHPAEAMHGDLGILGDKDVVLALSYSGASEELVTLIPLIRRREIPIVGITGETDSILSRNCDLLLPIKVEQEACPFNMAPTTSTTATLALGDALALVLLDAKGFTKEDYARCHPGGAIGKTLLLRVEDIMRTGDRLAAVPGGSLVKEALLAMTRARAGAVAVLEGQKVIGVFTDGDLRRHLDDEGPISNRKVDDVMTRDPISLTRDHLAVDVLRLFEKHNIDDLVIVDENGCLTGMVDLQDLPKLKIL